MKKEDKILIGGKIKELRKKRKLQLQELAKLSGVQLATLSRIEHDKMTGTIATHSKLAYCLGVELSELYKDIKPHDDKVEVFAKSSSPEIITDKKSSTQLLVNSIADKKMTPTLITIKENGEVTIMLSNESFIYVTKGKVKTEINGKDYTISANNSAYFQTPQNLDLKNIANKETEIIHVEIK